MKNNIKTKNKNIILLFKNNGFRYFVVNQKIFVEN